MVTPAAPQNLEVEVQDRYGSRAAAGTSTLHLSWDIVENATGYIVYYQTDADVFENRRASFSTSQSEASFTVNSDDIYIITVAAFRNSNSNISAESEPVAVSTLQNIEEVSPVLSNNRLSVMIRYPSVTYLGTRLIEPTFRIILTNADGSEPLYADGTEVHADFITKTPSYSFAKALAPSTSYSLTVRMGVNANNDDELTEDEIFASYILPAAFTTDADAYPDALTSVNAAMYGKNSIRVSFTAPPVKTGLSNVQRRFAITRTSNDGEVVEVWARENALTFNNGNDYYFIDDSGSLRSNIEYTYSVTSYYYFEDSNAYNRQSSDAATTSNSVHIFSTPINVTAKLTQSDTNTYTEEVTFTFPFGLPADATVKLYRMATSFSETASTWTEIADTKLTDNGNNSYTVTSTLTDEGTRSYSYKVEVTSSDGITSDAGISENVVSTGSQVANIASFDASNNLAGRINLSWTFNEGADVSSIRLLRSENSDYSNYTVVPTDISTTAIVETVDDSNASAIEDGKTYYYALEAKYGDGAVEYRYLSAKSLDPVTSIDASKGTHTDRIEVTWNEVSGASGYKVYARTTGDGAFTDADIMEGEITTSEDGICTYSFTEDVGTALAGRNWYFAVKPVDTNDNVSPSNNLVTATGNLLGPASIIVSASKNAYSDSILVTWNGVPGATQYELEVYASDADDADSIKREVISSQNSDGVYSFVLNAEDVASSNSAYLSQSYWFSIFPRYNASVSNEGTAKVEGCWVKPPTGITASKATSSVLTTVTWTPVEGAAGYNVYRRPYNSVEDWEYLEYTRSSSINYVDEGAGNRATNSYYEYTVAAIVGNVEGPVQTYFTIDNANIENLPNNVGFPLYHPEKFDVMLDTIDGTQYCILSFTENPYATSYVVSSSLMDVALEVPVESIGTSAPQTITNGSAYRDSDSGLVIVYATRPDVRTTVYVDMSVASKNVDIPYETDKVSGSVAKGGLIPSSLRSTEVVNLTNTALSQAINYPNSYFGSDWYREWLSESKETYSGNVGGGTITAQVKYAQWGTASMTVTNFQYNSVRISGSVEFGLSGSEFVGTVTPIGSIDSGTITVVLPLSFGNESITVSYDSVSINNSEGTYSVSRNGGAYTDSVSSTSVAVRPFS